MRVVDAVALDEDSVRITADGYLVADARIARTGIQTYLASELGMKDAQPGQVVRVLRSADEVFDKASMASIPWRPMTNDHPKDMVTATTWKRDAIGQLGDGARRETAQDGEYIRVPLTMMDGDAISQYRAGKRELSVGYTCDVDWTPGVTEGGETYDARQTNIRANHLALVHRGRAGSACRIGDSWPHRDDDAPPVKDQTSMKTIMIDGVPVADVSPAAEAVISTLQGRLTAANTAKDTAEGQVATLTTQAAAKDAEITTLKQSLADAKVTPQQLRDHAKAFAKTLADAKILAPSLTIGDAMDEAAIRKAVVSSKLGDAAKDWNDAQIEVSFATMAGSIADSQRQAAPSNPLADSIAAGAGAVIGDAAEKAVRDARAEYLADLTGQKAA